MREEIVDVVNESNQVLCQATKTDAHRQGLLHRTVMAQVRDYHDNMVLVRQAIGRQDASQLVSPVGGHVRANESEEDALKRETFEEIGLIDFSYKFIGRFIFNRFILGRQENHYFSVFEIGASSVDFVLGQEAVAVETLSEAEVIRALHETPQRFGGIFHAIAREFYPYLTYRGSASDRRGGGWPGG